jgi:hypothetical protein
MRNNKTIYFLPRVFTPTRADVEKFRLAFYEFVRKADKLPKP